MQRRIAHLDMDAFYASVELLRYPQLRGLPVVVGGRARAGESATQGFARLRDYVGRGVVTTASYEARKFGVRSAMGLMKAAALAPDAILLPADFEQYSRYSRLFKAAVAQIAPHVEDRGIDEIYIDLSAIDMDSRELAVRIKDNVHRATGLTCSIGITPNKLLSKLASELDKPDGLTILDYADIPHRIWPLAVAKVNGIGPRATAKLESLQIRTIGELAAAPPQWLIEHFGQHYGAWLHAAAHGRDERAVVTVREPKSISRETTFERDLHVKRDRAVLAQILLDLCQRLSGDLTRKGYFARGIGVKLRFDDFRIVTRDTTLERPSADAQVIRAAVRSCLKRVAFERRLRLLGVRASNLSDRAHVDASPPAQVQRIAQSLPLFTDE